MRVKLIPSANHFPRNLLLLGRGLYKPRIVGYNRARACTGLFCSFLVLINIIMERGIILDPWRYQNGLMEVAFWTHGGIILDPRGIILDP